MDDQKRQEIARLAGIVHDKHMRLNACRMRNIANLNYEDTKQAMIDTELARAEYYEACAVLAAAMPPANDVPRAEQLMRDAQSNAQSNWENPYIFPAGKQFYF